MTHKAGTKLSSIVGSERGAPLFHKTPKALSQRRGPTEVELRKETSGEQKNSDLMCDEDRSTAKTLFLVEDEGGFVGGQEAIL